MSTAFPEIQKGTESGCNQTPQHLPPLCHPSATPLPPLCRETGFETKQKDFKLIYDAQLLFIDIVFLEIL